MADLGFIALLFALAIALYSAVASAWGAWRRYPELVQSGRNGVLAVAGLLIVAAAVLFYLFLSYDFQTAYVANYSSREMATIYTFSAFWAGNPGSLLFWATLSAILSAIVILLHERNAAIRPLLPWVAMVTMTVIAFFVFLMVFVPHANPFEQLPYKPADGQGLNPLLENTGMFFHPLTLLTGYAGFLIPFAFAIAALITRRLGNEWVVAIRRWTLVAWFFLGVGNLFGMQWAYVELGWGGFWGWDPIENSSLMPWLIATAFLHSVMIQKRRGMLKVWNIVLIIIAFNLAIFGTFLTRSGILSSVHSFADSNLGIFFLSFIGISLVLSIGLLYERLPDLRSDNELDSFVSRESSFLFNNLLLVGATFATFLGVIFPIISEAVRGVKITVGPPFYNQVNGPIFAALVILMGICPIIGWRKASTNNLIRNFLYPTVVGIITAALLIVMGITQWYAVLGFAVCGFVIASITLEWFRGTRARHRTRRENYFTAFVGLVWANKPRYGGYVVHLSMVFIAMGIMGAIFFQTKAEATLAPGETLAIGNYQLKFDGLSEYATQSRQVTAASLTLYNGGEPVETMNAVKFVHRNHENPVTDVAIRSTPLEDVYVILVNWTKDGSASFQVFINPMVNWIWFGGVVFLIGTVIAFWPDRRQAREALVTASRTGR